MIRGRLHERLRKGAARVAGLKRGHEASGSVVLRNAWVDASLDAGVYAEVLPVIEAELAKSRLKSSWLIRRGRMRLGMGAREAGIKDLRDAVTELDPRIHPERPDVSLLIDRGWARVLLGEKEAARRDLKLARKHAGDPWDVDRLGKSIGE